MKSVQSLALGLVIFSTAYVAHAAPGLSLASRSGLRALESMSATQKRFAHGEQSAVEVIENGLSKTAIESHDGFKTANVRDVKLLPNGDVVESEYSLPSIQSSGQLAPPRFRDGALMGLTADRTTKENSVRMVQSFTTESIDGVNYRVKTSSSVLVDGSRHLIAWEKISQIDNKYLEFHMKQSDGLYPKRIELNKFDGKVIDWKLGESSKGLDITVYTAKDGHVYESHVFLKRGENHTSEQTANGEVHKNPIPLSAKQVEEMGLSASRLVFKGIKSNEAPRGMEIGKGSTSGGAS